MGRLTLSSTATDGDGADSSQSCTYFWAIKLQVIKLLGNILGGGGGGEKHQQRKNSSILELFKPLKKDLPSLILYFQKDTRVLLTVTSST